MNAVMDEALAAEQPETENEESEAGTLDEAAAEVERDGATTTATSSSRSPEAAPSETADAETSTSTSPSTSIPEITRQTTTVTSSPSNSPNPSTTRTSTSTTVTSSGPRGSTKPASTTPPTSTQPAVAIPTEPVNLPEPARTADAATVEVSGEDLDVVVRCATAPTDARTGARVLGNWINDDSSSTGDWKPFTSDDPDEDGWRWAAINQKTGTVVYIR